MKAYKSHEGYELTEDIRSRLSHRFSVMMKHRKMSEEEFIAPGYGPHDSIIEWCFEMMTDPCLNPALQHNKSEAEE